MNVSDLDQVFCYVNNIVSVTICEIFKINAIAASDYLTITFMLTYILQFQL